VCLIRFLVVDQNFTVDFLNYQPASSRLRHLLHVLLLMAIWKFYWLYRRKIITLDFEVVICRCSLASGQLSYYPATQLVTLGKEKNILMQQTGVR
jgi:hypothetical protein